MDQRAANPRAARTRPATVATEERNGAPLDMDSDRERFLTLIRRWHAGHPRGDKVLHCINVADWLERAVKHDPCRPGS